MAEQSEKVVIVVSTFYPKSDDNAELREIPELDKFLADKWKIVSIAPIVNQASTTSANLGSMQLIVRMQK